MPQTVPSRRLDLPLVALLLGLLLGAMAPPTSAQEPTRRILVVPAATWLAEPTSYAGRSDDVLTSPLRRCRLDGEESASTHHDRALWFANGLGGGVVLGPVGTLFAWVLAQDSDPIPGPGQLGERTGVCREAFLEGYRERARARNQWAAIAGGTLGTVILFTLVLVTT